ncbi:6-phosphofructo-2-kinase-domain-containing protein [Naematelia encephala]|uniref:fructose-2,6-bisphosphate 2-phosphatase n=1 Tax=Naematelia encephala TaxID=71784 RepID=A0A1Y2BF81_9TREE|nr:6-phosphofructo-2-kinase-domain-containing protein [Naematelia encephala]
MTGMPPPPAPMTSLPRSQSQSRGSKTPKTPRSPNLRPSSSNSLMSDLNVPPIPVEPQVLENAIKNLDVLRSTKTPSSTTAPSPAASGASSPSGSHMPGADKVAAAIGAALSGEPKTISAPGTPHFGAQSDLLKALDDTTKVFRQTSMAPTRAPSVSGIGTVVEKPDYSEAKIVVAMVGLPARGKSYLSNKLMRYLRWLEYNVEVFNVGQLRRSKARTQQQQGQGKADHSATWFSHSNAEANLAREKLAEESLESLIAWLKKEGNVGIMDATNSTFDRRDKIRERLSHEPNLQLLFIESFCNDPAVIAANIALKVQSGDPDYAGMSREEAERDFRKRIDAYESVYQTITEPGISFCRILNVGQQVTMNRIQGYLQSRVAFYLMNLHLKPRSIYLSRHGESMYNVEGKIGGDSDLSPRGWEYAKALPALVKDNIGDGPLEVWTSTLQRTQQTGSLLPFEKKTWKSLDELDAGVCDGMTYEEIEEKYPEDYESRDEDKFNYRYRGGESYRDVVVRLEPVIMELERQENILIIGHQAILRCLYAYFLALPQEELPYIVIPLHTLIKITPMAYGCHEERYHLPIAAVDTHRPKPQKAGAGGSHPHSRKQSVIDVGETVSRAPVSRDYFGDLSKVMGDATSVGVEQATEQLMRAKESGELTPKVGKRVVQ